MFRLIEKQIEKQIENSNDNGGVDVNVDVKGTSLFKIIATFESSHYYNIDVNLGDKNVVKKWWIEYGSLHILFTNGKHKVYYTSRYSNSDEDELTYINVRDLDDGDYVDDEDEDEDEDEDDVGDLDDDDDIDEGINE